MAPTPPATTTDHIPIWIIILDSIYILLAAGGALAYYHWAWLQHLIPKQLGPVPVGVPWWGVIGGLTISFGGIVKYRRSFDTSMAIWYVFKPFLSMIAAAASYLIIILLIRSTGTTVKADAVTFYVLGFLVGYREETFRTLIKEATDLILKPGKST